MSSVFGLLFAGNSLIVANYFMKIYRSENLVNVGRNEEIFNKGSDVNCNLFQSTVTPQGNRSKSKEKKKSLRTSTYKAELLNRNLLNKYETHYH
jgi:hypothetical protein